MLVLLAADDPLRVSIGTGVVLLGIPVYQMFFRKAEEGDLTSNG
jgi:hypothetical protein